MEHTDIFELGGRQLGSRLFTGRDASINVVESSIGAWLNAMNKVMQAIEADKGV